MKTKTIDELNKEVDALTVEFYSYGCRGIEIGPFETYEEAQENMGDYPGIIAKRKETGFEAAKILKELGKEPLFSTIK